MPDSKPLKVALYARVSTDDKGQIPETQINKLYSIAKARGDEIGGIYVDQASGANSRRPALQSMLMDAKAHKFDRVMVTKLDRMMRSTANMIKVLEELNNWGVGFECSDQDIDTTSPSGRLLFTVLSAIAEFERDLCSSRVKDGMAAAKAKGKHIGHPKGQKNANKRGHKKQTPLYLSPDSQSMQAGTERDKGNPLSNVEGE